MARGARLEPTPSVRTTGVLVTIPVHNEAARIRESIGRVTQALDRSSIPYLLSVAEDASTDGTPEILAELQREYPQLRVMSRHDAHGRGSALRALWTTIDAAAYAYVDADLAMGTQALIHCTRIVLDQRAPVVTASRLCPGATVRRPPLRHAASLGYNQLIRLLFDDAIYDHQCGLKVFSRAALEQLLPFTYNDHWFWDTEMLILARTAGMGIAEVPVAWTETKYDRTSWTRLMREIVGFAAGIVHFKGSLDSPTRRRLNGRAPARSPAPPGLDGSASGPLAEWSH